MPPPTEPTLLSRFLLPPSSLHTIIPYPQFLTLLPSHLRKTATTDPTSPTGILIKQLYQDLQFQRDMDIDTVALNIQRECTRSEILKGRLKQAIKEELNQSTSTRQSTATSSRKRKRTNEQNDQPHSQNPEASNAAEYHPLTNPLEARLDTLFTGPRGLALPNQSPAAKYHTPTSLLGTISSSITALKSEINHLNHRSSSSLARMNDVVGSMSDLRYGKFARVNGSTGSRQSIGSAGEVSGENAREGGLEEQVSEALRELKQVVDRKTKRLK